MKLHEAKKTIRKRKSVTFVMQDKFGMRSVLWHAYITLFERLHLELEYIREDLPLILLTRPNILLFLNAHSFSSFQNKDMRIVAWVATKVTHGPVLREYDAI